MNTNSAYYRLAWALATIMDGMKEHEIHEETGLPDIWCKLLHKIRNEALELVQDMHWKQPE